jgi:WD40 repeat protein
MYTYTKVILPLIVFLLSAFSSKTQSPTTIQFGITLGLIRPLDVYINNPVFSTDGNWLIATVNTVDVELRGQGRTDMLLSATQYLWQLSVLEENEDILELEPYTVLHIDETPLGPDFAFSADTNYLAVRTDTEIQLYNVFDFSLRQTLAVQSAFERTFGLLDVLAWSDNSQLVATIDGQDIIVWNITDYTVSRQTLGQAYDYIIALESGWVVGHEDLNGLYSDSFTTCTWHLETCITHQLPYSAHTIVISPDGQSIITMSGDVRSSDRIAELWSRQTNGTYHITSSTLPSDLLTVFSFSPNSQYLVAFSPSNRVDDWTIWSFPDLSPVMRIMPPSTSTPIVDEPVWFPDGQHLAVFYMWDDFQLKLFEVGNDSPLDELDLTEMLNGQDIGEWTLLDSLGFDPVQISPNGQSLVIAIGEALLVVPISYG